jgi:hypothetical protein
MEDGSKYDEGGAGFNPGRLLAVYMKFGCHQTVWLAAYFDALLGDLSESTERRSSPALLLEGSKYYFLLGYEYGYFNREFKIRAKYNQRSYMKL